ncbi:MAG: DUF3006 domain-containing protein [Synergistaceae bacterium]|jgi:hypothetical protein|nr:DUF3006 domain-containing protein [Synergistaceae bacterium]
MYFFVDRMTEGFATLIAEGDNAGAIELPRAFLPKGAREGDWLKTSFEIDAAKKSSVSREIDSLMDELEK